MNALRFALVAAIVATAALSPAKAADNSESLIELWRNANSLCRGGSGDDPQTMKACDIREDYTQRLRKLGWCYGRQGEYGYQNDWHRCGD